MYCPPYHIVLNVDVVHNEPYTGTKATLLIWYLKIQAASHMTILILSLQEAQLEPHHQGMLGFVGFVARELIKGSVT